MSARHRVLKYVGYYSAQENKSENRDHVLAASDKMDYVIGALNRLGFAVQVVSASATRSRRGHGGRLVELENGNTLRLFRTLPWGAKWRRISSVLSMRFFLLSWLLFNTRPGEDVIVYHSLGYAFVVALAKRVRKFRLILEVEEMYADVTGRQADRRTEAKVFKQADAFIFPTGLLNETLNMRGRPYAVVHGTYQAEAPRDCVFDDGRIHVVYAGTFDPRKGVTSAVEACLFLDSRYHVHIIGFGTQRDKQSVLGLIADVSMRSECRITYDGLLAGEEYVEFLQSCDIGLSVQRTTAEFNETSFPSKVLSYMANGLRVVSIRLKALEQSGVGDLLIYYDEDSPQAIASAIKEVDLSQRCACRERLQQLDMSFVRALGQLLTE